MAYGTKDGKRRFENPEIGRAYDRSHGGGGKMPVAKRNPLKPEGMPGEPIGQHEGAEPSEHEPGAEIESVVAEHGPAHHTEIHAAGGQEQMGEMGGGAGAGMGGGGSHHVVSHHASGHVHHSHGHSLESAHVHSHKAMGGSGEMHSEPDGDEGMGAEMMPEHEEE